MLLTEAEAQHYALAWSGPRKPCVTKMRDTLHAFYAAMAAVALVFAVLAWGSVFATMIGVSPW